MVAKISRADATEYAKRANIFVTAEEFFERNDVTL